MVSRLFPTHEPHAPARPRHRPWDARGRRVTPRAGYREVTTIASRASGGFLSCAAMAREQYLNHLASVPLFSGCTTKELRDIARATVELTLDAGKEFVTQGDVGREAFVIVEGQADVTRACQVIARLGPGDCVAEMALLDHGPRTASVTAAT